ncbi:MAG: hypothetical protein HUJ72_09065 [Blautia sp.]|nr:hypothetical protein [Blautia sp.]
MNELSSLQAMALSPYDDSLPAKLLQEAFDFRVQEANLMTERIYRDVVKKSGSGITIPKEGEEKLRLTVDTSEEMLQDYKDGAIKLAQEKGHMVAQLKENGKYGSKLPIKEETYMDGPDSLEVQNALQLQAVQEALETISEQIQAIDENVKEVLTGQQNDRLGRYYSGVALFIEANNVTDEAFRKQLMAQSVKALSDSVFQLTLTLQTDILYLARKEYDRNKKTKFNLINEKIDSINRAFMAIHQATIMKSAIYCLQGEIKAMVSVLQEYERFIMGTIVGNAEMLSLCDADEKRKLDGTWKKRAALQLEVSSVVAQLQSPDSVIYIQDKGEEINESF